MATPVADAYSAPSGAAVYAGRYAPGGCVTGSALLDSLLASGGFGAGVPSVLSGGATLSDMAASGSMSGSVVWPFSLPSVGSLGIISSNVLTDITPTGGAVNKSNEDFSLSKVLGCWAGPVVVLLKTAGAVTDVLYLMFNGGHGDTGNDGVYGWRASTGLMEGFLAPLKSAAAVCPDPTYGEGPTSGRPDSQHTYGHLHGLNSDEANGPALMQLIGTALGTSVAISGQAHKFDTAAKTWARYGSLGTAGSSTANFVIKDTSRQKFFRFQSDAGTAFYSLDYSLANPTWQTLAQTARSGGWSDTYEADGCYDPVRDLYIAGRFSGGANHIRALDANNPTGAWVALTLTGDSITSTYGMGLEYRSATGTFILIEAANPPTAYYEITPPSSSPLTNAWTVVRKTFTGTSRFANSVSATAEWFHRWRYVNFPGLGDALISCPAPGYAMEAIKL